MGKRKSEEMAADDDQDADKSTTVDNWDLLVTRLKPFALSKLATKKLTKKLYRLIKKGDISRAIIGDLLNFFFILNPLSVFYNNARSVVNPRLSVLLITCD